MPFAASDHGEFMSSEDRAFQQESRARNRQLRQLVLAGQIASLQQELRELQKEHLIEASTGTSGETESAGDDGQSASTEWFFPQLVRDLPDLGTWELDLSTGQIEMSAGLQNLLGLRMNESVSLDQLWPMIADDDRPRIENVLDQAHTGESAHFYEEFQLRGHDGRWRWMASKGAVVRATTGEPARIVGISLDITERRMAEEALRHSERSLRELADSMPQIVWAADAHGRVEYFNRRWSEYTGAGGGVSPREVRADFVHPDDRSRATQAWDEAIASQSPMQVEYRLRQASTGEYRWHLARAVPIRGESGAILRWFGTATDIHAQKSLQDSLREADHRKDQFLAMLAHELRNPLSPLMLAADLIASEEELAPPVREMAEMMRRQTTQLRRLIDDLLDVSRVSTGRLELKRERVQLQSAIEAALDVSRPLIESARHHLEVDLPAEPIELEGDHVRLTQVVGNLLINAAKYTPARGRIRLAVVRQDGAIRIDVEDNGIGIPRHMLSKVFDLFAQVDSSTTRSQNGLGIGLTLVRTLVEMHGGAVAAESPGPGQGSRFQISLPLASMNPDAGKADLMTPPAPSSNRRRRVLIIDDNESASYLLGKLLEKLGQDVRVERSAIHALRSLEAFQPDIVISDIAMPEVSGHELARMIRALPLAHQPILVALTGYGQEDDRRASLAAGFDQHVTKPIDIATLKSLLEPHH